MTQQFSRTPARRAAIEWPTLYMLVACYAAWAVGTVALPALSLSLAIFVTGVAITLYASLCHEVIHGHPTRNDWVNTALVFPALTVLIPYGRFRDTHLDHHHDPTLTDPYEDPESNFLDPGDWARLPRPVQWVMILHNSLLGRMVLGPVIGTARFLWTDLKTMTRGDRAVLAAWAWHVPALALLALWLDHIATMPLWAYGLATYLGFALLRIRVFLEHRAHPLPRARTAIVEDRGPLALLFLNNNLHAVHHAHPQVPWYALPAVYRAHRDAYLRRNEGYSFGSYGEVISTYLLRPKDPVAHPLREAAPQPAPEGITEQGAPLSTG